MWTQDSNVAKWLEGLSFKLLVLGLNPPFQNGPELYLISVFWLKQSNPFRILVTVSLYFITRTTFATGK